jgi:hypothetical protein
MRDTPAMPPASAWSARRAGLAFVAGFLAVLVFHQPVFALLHAAGLIPVAAYNVRPVPPFGVPEVLSAAFWGGVWGVVFALVEPRLPRGPGYWVAAALFGAVALTVVFWFVAAPLKGLPVAGGVSRVAMEWRVTESRAAISLPAGVAWRAVPARAP